jgi:lipid-binding SYLF domain-containing protein
MQNEIIKQHRSTFILSAFAVALIVFGSYITAFAASSKEELNTEANQSLDKLLTTNQTAADISKQAKAVLIFPSIVKAGLVFGGAYGEGVLVEGENIDSYYNSITASWGLQAGAQSYGYVVFLVTDKAVKYIKDTRGWEIGVGPTVVLVDQGAAKNLSTTTLKDDAYAFAFDQQGLMAGLSLEGTKISQIKNP